MVLTKERFIEVYSNLPIGVRREIILVINNQPISWNAAYVEISQDTIVGKELLKKLDELGIFGRDKNGKTK